MLTPPEFVIENTFVVVLNDTVKVSPRPANTLFASSCALRSAAMAAPVT